MLKLAYSDIGVHVERVSGSVVQVITRRRLLAHRTGQTFYVEPSYAAMIIPESMPEVTLLERAIAQSQTNEGAFSPSNDLEDDETISICASLTNGIEIILQGYWLANSANAAEGLFFATLQPTIEDHLIKIWELAGASITSCTWPTGKPISELGYEF